MSAATSSVPVTGSADTSSGPSTSSIDSFKLASGVSAFPISAASMMIAPSAPSAKMESCSPVGLAAISKGERASRITPTISVAELPNNSRQYNGTCAA